MELLREPVFGAIGIICVAACFLKTIVLLAWEPVFGLVGIACLIAFSKLYSKY